MTNAEAIEILKCIFENLAVQSRCDGKTIMRFHMREAIIKAIDALEREAKENDKVVHCRSCKFYNCDCKYPVCVFHDDNVEENDFCSKGEER